MIKLHFIVLLLTFCLAISNVFANSAADALLNTVTIGAAGIKNAAPVGTQQPTSPSSGEIKLDNPLVIQLFSTWQGEKNLPYDLNAWVLRILTKQHREAAHLWSAVQKQVPASFEITANAAYLYLLWRENLSHTFFNEWTTMLSNDWFSKSTIALALEQTIAPDFDKWLLTNAISISPEQESILKKFDVTRSTVHASLQAFINLRRGGAAEQLTMIIPTTSWLKPHLARTVALSYAKKNDLASAAKILKTYAEPTLEARADARGLATHYLQIARFLYQAGSLEGAEHFYLKIPSGTQEFMSAREELTWVWLRQGNLQKLRGEIATLSTRLFEDRFTPELYLVRAISNLKLCYFSEVQKDFDSFISNNKIWAKEISKALKAEDPPAPKQVDFFSTVAANRLVRMTAEQEQLRGLANESVTAALPAVGQQQHWVRAQDKLSTAIENAKKTKAEEYRRQWRSMHSALTEAIRKMQFVKVEFLSQLRSLASTSAEPATGDDTIRLSRAAPLKKERDEMAFLFDGVMWPDELFKLRSIADGRCLNGDSK
ncbi:MAG: hypothetical protein AABZ06_07535 [Bdellovibrionota bacterium]